MPPEPDVASDLVLLDAIASAARASEPPRGSAQRELFEALQALVVAYPKDGRWRPILNRIRPLMMAVPSVCARRTTDDELARAMLDEILKIVPATEREAWRTLFDGKPPKLGHRIVDLEKVFGLSPDRPRSTTPHSSKYAIVHKLAAHVATVVREGLNEHATHEPAAVLQEEAGQSPRPEVDLSGLDVDELLKRCGITLDLSGLDARLNGHEPDGLGDELPPRRKGWRRRRPRSEGRHPD